jgi:hypothetical protein
MLLLLRTAEAVNITSRVNNENIVTKPPFSQQNKHGSYKHPSVPVEEHLIWFMSQAQTL